MLKELTYVVSAENHPDLLVRTVMLFHRLAVPIHGLTMQRPRTSGRMRVTVEVLADPKQSDHIAASLAKIVHVVSIELRKRVDKRIRKPCYALARKR